MENSLRRGITLEFKSERGTELFEGVVYDPHLEEREMSVDLDHQCSGKSGFRD